MTKKLAVTMILALGLLVLPLVTYAATVFQEIQSYTSFCISLEGQWRSYKYNDLGINEQFKCDYDSPQFDVTLQKKGFLGVPTKVGAVMNRPTNTGKRYCYRWTGANADGGEFRYVFNAHNFTQGYRYYIYDTVTLVSEQ